MAAFKQNFESLLKQFAEAKTATEQSALFAQINNEKSTFTTLSAIAEVRHESNTTDAYWMGEKEYYDHIAPDYQELVTNSYKALIHTPFRPELEKIWGAHFFNIAEVSIKTFSPEILDDLREENQLITEWGKLNASAIIPYEGRELTLAAMMPYRTAADRETRRKANLAYWNFYDEHAEQFDTIYHNLVQVRTRIAHKLGYKNFVELGYVRMRRTDYNADMVAKFRTQIRELIVPLANQLRQRQAQRIGLDKLTFYDTGLTFKTGNATPKGSPEWILENGRKMYEELSHETAEFVNYLLDNELIDVLLRKGKSSGGFCTFFPDYGAPFIFANFNGTAGDIDVLTHEAGHAFQVYSSKQHKLVEYAFPTYEACEIHSMSMEFLTYPWMQNFFQEDTAKYKFAHLSAAITIMPYMALVDEFQHFVYENPHATPLQRKQAWQRLENIYQPTIDNSECPVLKNGGAWYRQGHIFQAPFYYIDYALAQVCALQFWKRANENHQHAVQDYIRLCREGGSKSFLQLVQLAQLKSPFDETCVASIINDVEETLAQVDDLAF